MARAVVVTSASAHALLSGLVDYAGLFPPAALAMDEAVVEYARWRRAPEAFMLGRFVAPAARLGELARAADTLLPEAGADDPWRVSALLGVDVGADAALVEAWNASHAGRAVVDAVELKAASPRAAEDALGALPAGLVAYVEVAADGDLDGVLAALKRRRARAKLRTGGVVPDAIPDVRTVAAFIAACAKADVPFKATAGLHHPVRSERPLTYEADSPRAIMHGFLNVFAAAAFARAGATEAELEAVLGEQDVEAFQLDDAGLAWRGRRSTTHELADARARFAASFGSCSFAEPVADLRELGVLALEPAAASRGPA